MSNYAPLPFAPVVDVDHWYAPKTSAGLGRLLAAIRQTADTAVRNFLEVCFSSCVKRLSYADPRLSVPVRLKDLPDAPGSRHIKAIFERVVLTNLGRVQRLGLALPAGAKLDGLAEDARQCGDVVRRTGNAKLVITSPPYLSAQKYVRASSLSLGWLDLVPEAKLRSLERLNIGREHLDANELLDGLDQTVPSAVAEVDELFALNSTRARIAATYLREMHDALKATVQVMQAGAHFVLVIGDNTVCGRPFHTGRYLAAILCDLGLSQRLELIDDIRSRGLMTKRNKTAGMISREHILVFHKPSA